ncbi:hypothetical protein ACFO0N_04825 [Halobium salinum]|uniref:DUF7130 domain-containing protein n=1 Tax=Halobium salinum TaxID=1364940 RepID=A0ABD5P8R0_9EURY|nr:hypothetical protein [Halobium salinum]
MSSQSLPPRTDRRLRASARPSRTTLTSDHTSAGAIPRGVSLRHERLPQQGFGEAFLVWRCLDCGATGDLEAFPTACADCGSPREHLYYYTED